MAAERDYTAMVRMMTMKNRPVIVSAAVWMIALITVHLAAAAHPPECSDIAHGRSCSLDSNAGTVAVLGNRVFVGVADHIYSFERDLTLLQSVNVNPQEDNINTCATLFPGGLFTSECKNFIRVIQQVPSGFETNSIDKGQIMVCGTNAFFPRCTIHQSDNLSNYSFMTSGNTADEGYSPYSNSDPIVALLASNGRFFSATVFQPFQSQQRTIGMASSPLRGDSLFHVTAPTSDPLWFNRPEFISTYEIGEHIYFFIREPAYEVDDGESVVYSRAIRICKTDNGQVPGTSSGTTDFLTYQKARMRCSYSGQRGSIPYNYDNLESTFLWNGTGNQSLTLYGVFSSPDNGPEGGAICKFSFDETVEGSLTQVFEDGDYTVRVTQNSQQVWITEQPGPFSCPGTTGTQRTVEQANRYQLVASSVEAMDPEPLHVVSGKKLDKIAVDVIVFDGSVQEVVYFTTDSGEIRQVVHVAGSGSSSQVDHVIQSIDGAVSYLSVHQGNGETRQLYATTEDTIVTVSRGNCTQYQSCFECLDSRDAYCGWTNKCTNKLTARSISGLIEAHSVSEETIVSTCGTRPDDQNPTPVVPTVSCPLPPRPTNGNDDQATNVICPPETVGLSDKEQTDMDIPTIVGATVGAFVLGVPVGAFVCFIFFRMFVKPRQTKSSGGLEESYSSTRQAPYNLHSDGSPSMSNTSVTEQGGDSSTNTLPKKDLSISIDVVANSSVLQQSGPPRYVDVRPKSGSVPSGINGSAIPPSGGGNENKRSSTASETVTNKRSSTASETVAMSKMREKDDSAFGGSEKDILPPLVGSEELETYKKHMKQSKHHGTPVNGVSRVQVPGFKVPKGRTPSTTWLRENSVSDASSDLSSPLQSPISDV